MSTSSNLRDTGLRDTSARVLEFERLKEIVAGHATSPVGRARVLALEPSTDAAWVERQQGLSVEIRAFLEAGGGFDFGGLFDPERLLQQARIEGVALDAESIRDLLLVVERIQEWRGILRNPPAEVAGRWPWVEALGADVQDFGDLLRALRGKILPDGGIDDDASPGLRHVRREIERQRRHIQESLRGCLRRLSEGGAVQDELITIRGERFVIPVRVEQKRRVSGVVHGASSSGQTVYVEPLETIEQNNELVRLMEEELAEIHRILLDMTRQIGARSHAIQHGSDVLAELEVQFAKARFAEAYACVAPAFTKSDLVLKGARHPVLERTLRAKGGSVVPLTLELLGTAEPPQRQLIISGPNTGGKTVTLKTVGLLALMAQAGIPVPAEEARFPLFDAVMADIGDYQSIEASLSTFSAHVTHIDRIARTATPRTLVLLDELGSATDPEEGAALAVAIAGRFLELGALSIISTHLTSLKVYAANRPGVVNAAVGFDERTLQPTYELRLGVPGASAGINIAQRLGLNPEIVADARARLATQTQDIAHFLDRLHAELAAAEAERAELRRREQEVARERNCLEFEGRREQQQKVRELERKLDDLLKDFEYQAREAVAAVQDRAAQQKLSKEAERRIARLRREFREQFNQGVVAHATGADKGDDDARPHVVKHVSEGDTVKLKSLGKTGVVTRRIDDQAFEVAIGPMKMRVPREDIAEVLASARRPQGTQTPVEAARSRGISVRLRSEPGDVSMRSEINVIGRTVDEATREVDQFVDQAFLAGLPRIRIVHGSGMGILRKSLRQFLQRHPHVATIAEPPQNEGGAGATVVDLRQ